MKPAAVNPGGGHAGEKNGWGRRQARPRPGALGGLLSSTWRFVRDYVTPFFGPLGFALGLTIILWDRHATPESQRFVATTQFLMWVTLIAGQTALWLALTVPLCRSLLKLKVGRADVDRVVLYAAFYAIGAVLVAFSTGGGPEIRPLAHHVWKLRLINFLGAFVVGLALSGILLAQAALERLQRNIEQGGARAYSRKVVEDFLEIRTHLERFLLTTGLFVGAATLATGGLRNATLAYDPQTNFPREHVLIYGLLASGLLALVYAPAHARLVAVRARLRDALVPLPAEKPESWSGWSAERKAVEELLEIHSGVIAAFAGSVSILTPLIGSLLAILLGADE